MNPKQSQQQQRSRGRSNGGNVVRGPQNGGHKHINIRIQNFDSNGPEGRIRGSAHQVMEKYLALGRDAFSQGDRVAAENFYQHAEHYLRLINAYNQSQPAPRRTEETADNTQPVIAEAPVVADAASGGDVVTVTEEQPPVLPVESVSATEQPQVSVG